MLQLYLKELGVDYQVDPGIVRGLDYYRMTSFEIKLEALGAQSTICGGGRYDGLVELLDGPNVPGIGFGMGMDRLLIAKDMQSEPEEETPKGILMIALLEDKSVPVRELALLRRKGLDVELEVTGRSLKSALKYADKQHYDTVLIYGESEREKDVFVVKHLQRGEQQEIPTAELVSYLEENHG